MVQRLEFYDVKNRENFSTSKYIIKTKVVRGKSRKFAVAISPYPGKIQSWRILPNK